MPKRHDKITKSVNYDYYWDILFCTVPLLAVSCFYYGARPLLMMAAGLLTAYVADCVVTPLHAAGYRAHEPSSEAFAALIVLMMPASAPYYMVVTATIIAVLVKEAFGGEGHYPFHPAAVGAAIAGVSWPEHVYYYPAPGTQLPIWGEINDNLVQGMNESLRSGGLPSASTMNLLTGNVSAGIGTGAALGIATYAFRIFSPYQSAICFALLIVGAIPEWLDLISHRTERIRFMKKEEQRLAKSTKPE